MKKSLLILSALLALSMAFVGCEGGSDPVQDPVEQDPAVEEVGTPIWEGTLVLDGKWDGDKAGKIGADKFADIAEGGKIEIYANGTAQLRVNVDGWPAIPSVEPSQDPKYGNVEISEKFSFVLTAEDVKLLKNGGMVLFGADITYTKVVYIPAE